jgi:uncharacterized membrane protein YphA (DoxX/SURF4 family)
MKKIKYLLATVFSFLTLPLDVFGYEVYVLTKEEIESLENLEPVSLFDIFLANTSDTIIWAVAIGFIVASVFLISISTSMENKFDKYLVKLKKYAPFIARVTVGLGFLASSYNAALFGPELPFTEIFGEYTTLAQVVFTMLGTFMVFGLFSRVAGLIGLMIFMLGISNHGTYMLTYVDYFAELIVLILVGGHKFAAAEEHHHWWQISDLLNYLSVKYGELSFLILRVCFGLSLIFSAVYAKILNNQLAFKVVYDYNLVEVFNMSAEFIVFGAAMIEIMLGIFFVLGIEIRFNALVINVFLTLSLLQFGEVAWPHIIPIGITTAFFCYGYDKYSLEGHFFKKGNREPIF